jgi:hypothetical protein
MPVPAGRDRLTGFTAGIRGIRRGRSRVPGIAAEMTSGAADTVTIEPQVEMTIVLGDGPWQRRFGGDPDGAGRARTLLTTMSLQ